MNLEEISVYLITKSEKIYRNYLSLVKLKLMVTEILTQHYSNLDWYYIDTHISFVYTELTDYILKNEDVQSIQLDEIDDNGVFEKYIHILDEDASCRLETLREM